ncbi:hypothetical protein ACSBR1_004701 [Camellia fascicularis]
MMNPKGIFNLFNNFGVVKDVFILTKRRKATGSRFRFVWYHGPVSTEVALQKTNGIWCEDKRLKVKMAEFNMIVQRENGKEEKVMITVQRNHLGMKPDASLAIGKEKCPMRPRREGRGQKSYAEVVSRREEQWKDAITVMVKEEGNGWLHENVIVQLKTFISFQDFKEEVSRRGMQEVLVREGGGSNVDI